MSVNKIVSFVGFKPKKIVEMKALIEQIAASNGMTESIVQWGGSGDFLLLLVVVCKPDLVGVLQDENNAGLLKNAAMFIEDFPDPTPKPRNPAP